eukprot:TRINITY_DN25951_c0_g4_i1.p1 TRINITY_DN25951_c0_g4~~TRINITY_DN25951_c0_g4_i1.p1  ORF type:complete len:240 (+),score=46.88 TRINITY_DN25951_c0_g4_i1:80-799(+)
MAPSLSALAGTWESVGTSSPEHTSMSSLTLPLSGRTCHRATSFAPTATMPPVMPLPPPPAAAAAQWAQHAYTASTQAAAAKAAAAKAAEVASAQAAAAQAAATQAQVAQVSAQQAAAAQVAQSLGYNVAPVGVPTAAAYGSVPGGAPPSGAAPGMPAAAGFSEAAVLLTALLPKSWLPSASTELRGCKAPAALCLRQGSIAGASVGQRAAKCRGALHGAQASSRASQFLAPVPREELSA